MEHIFCDCVFARAAMRALGGRPEKHLREAARVLGRATGPDFLLQTDSFAAKELVILLVFSKAVWRARWRCSGSTFSKNYVSRLIADNFVSFFRCRFRWSFRNKQLEKIVFQKLLKTLRRDSLHIYTDGSSIGCFFQQSSGSALFKYLDLNSKYI